MDYLNMVAIPLLARVFLVILFPFSALDKIFHWKDALKQANSSFLPGASVLLIFAIIVEVLMPVCIVLGWHDRLAALILASFCVVTAILYHPFWKFPHFWSQAGEGREHFWDFLKNFGLVGGLILLSISGFPVAANYVISHPLSSAPYAANTVVSSR